MFEEAVLQYRLFETESKLAAAVAIDAERKHQTVLHRFSIHYGLPENRLKQVKFSA